MEKRLRKIEERLSQIKQMLNDEDADIEALSKETEELLAERVKCLEQIEKRRTMLDMIASGKVGEGTPVIQTDEERQYDSKSEEYRAAFLKKIRNIKLSDKEQRVLTTNTDSAGAAIPAQTLNKIIEKVGQYAPILEKIDLLNIKGNVVIPAEGETVEAKIHTEGAAISSDDEKLGKITLGNYEITKLITISKSVETMSIDAFERWLVKKIGKEIAKKITKLILYGTGTNEPQGIDAIPWNEKNSVTVKADAILKEQDIDDAVGLLPGGYDAFAEFYMSKKTFFKDYRPIQNKSKNDVITKEGRTWYVNGYPVNFDERIKLHDAFLANFEDGYVGNMPEEASVTSSFVTRENSFDFLGSAMFDGKVSACEAFVKITKEAAAS